MTSTPSIRTGHSGGQAPIAPDRMSLVEDWQAPGGVGIELYADRNRDDGYLIACGAYAPERAATITGVTGDSPHVTWTGTWAQRDRSWRNVQAGLARKHLSEWSR